MTNLPPVIVIECGQEELQNAHVSNMLAVLVDVLQHRLRSAHRSVVLLLLPPSNVFSFISQTGARDVRIVGADFFEQDYIAHSAWNFVSLGDGARICADAIKSSNDLNHALKESASSSAHARFVCMLHHRDVSLNRLITRLCRGRPVPAAAVGTVEFATASVFVCSMASLILILT
jgi:hypothetical protein